MAKYYFSSSTGNDSTGNGSINTPWANFWNKKASASALSAGDICYFKAGDTWTGGNAYVNVDSNGSAGNLIILDRYGVGNDPVFTTASITTGWTLYSGSIYKKAGLFGSTYTIGVDGTSALGRWTGTNTTLPAGSFRNESGTIYIRLADSSNPSSHTIYVPTAYQFDENRGVVRGSTTRGSFLSINHFKVMYSNGSAFTFSQPDSTFNDCTAIGNGRDGFTFIGYAPASEAATRCRAVRCYASYNNANGNGYGQAYTVGASYVWIISSTAELNFKEGIDFLDYGSDTDVHHGGTVYCTTYANNQDPSATFGGAGIYFDGCHDMLCYGCVCHGSGTVNDAQLSDNMNVSTEHQSQPVSNIHIINNLFYDTASYNLVIKNGGDYPSYNNGDALVGCTIANNTFIRGTNGYGACMLPSGWGTSTKNIVKNNLFYRTGAGSGTKYPLAWVGSNLNSTNADMDYNCFYDTTTSGSIVASINESTSSYTLATWRTLTGGDSHSISSNPFIINSTVSTLDAHLQRVSLGQANTSGCIGAGIATPWTPPQWVIDAGVLADSGAVVGTTRSDGVSTAATDIGYHYYVPTPNGNLTVTNVQPASLYLNTVNTNTITFTTATAWPADGTLVITYPISLGGGFTFSSGATTTATFNSGGSGSLTFSAVGGIVTLTRSGGSIINASQAVSIALTNVLNPPQAGSTGPYQLKTTTSAGTSIDVDTNVAADQIIAAPQSFVTISMRGVNLSNVKVNG